MTKQRDIKCRKCQKNNWKASTETDDDVDGATTMLFLTCKCGHVWTAQLE